MAISLKDKYLKAIAQAVGRGAVDFEAEDRPRLEMGGRQVYVGSVYYDLDRGELAFSVCNERGDVYPSVHGMRPLSSLDQRTLSGLREVTDRYRRMRVRRDENLSRIAAQANVLARRRSFPSL